MQQRLNKTNTEQALLSPEQLAAHIGVAVGTVYGWTYMKAIPYYKIGRLVKFRPVEIELWLKERHVKPNDKLS